MAVRPGLGHVVVSRSDRQLARKKKKSYNRKYVP